MCVNPDCDLQQFDTSYTTTEVSGACGQGLPQCNTQTTAQANSRRRTFKNAGMDELCS